MCVRGPSVLQKWMTVPNLVSVLLTRDTRTFDSHVTTPSQNEVSIFLLWLQNSQIIFASTDKCCIISLSSLGFFFPKKHYLYPLLYFFLVMIHVDVFAQAVRHGDIYARSEIWNNNNVKRKLYRRVSVKQSISVCGLWLIYSVFIDHMGWWDCWRRFSYWTEMSFVSFQVFLIVG